MKILLLEDCCEILDSKRVPITAKDRKKGPYPYYGANGVQDYVADYIFDDELVLLAEDGGNFGSEERPIAYKVSGKCWVNNHAHVLKPKAGIDVDYLCYSLMFYRVDGMVNGATRMKLTQAAMRKMRIQSRKIEEQKAIVGVLNRVQRLIKVEREQITRYDDLIKSRFVEMFGDSFTNPMRWKKSLLGEVCDVRDGTHDTPKYYESGYPLVTSKNVTSGKIDIRDCSYICEEDFVKINERSKVDIGDIIMPMIGTVGKPVIVTIEPNFAIKNVALIKFNDASSVDNIYVKTLLESEYFDRSVLSKIRGGTQKFIALGDIRRLEILLPTIDKQKEFREFVEQVGQLKSKTQKSLDKTQLLFNSLMQQYFG
jgi:type I restriction enzyme S subunit